jgi:hypothetical protein
VFDSEPEATAWTVETVWNAGLHIMGSRTFHDMAAYWPTSTEAFAPPMNQIPKAVFSRQGPAILTAINTTAALRDARANAGTIWFEIFERLTGSSAITGMRHQRFDLRPLRVGKPKRCDPHPNLRPAWSLQSHRRSFGNPIIEYRP